MKVSDEMLANLLTQIKYGHIDNWGALELAIRELCRIRLLIEERFDE